MKDEIISLYAYNRWANERVLNALRPLSEDDYTKEMGGGWPSLRATLVHLAGASEAWAVRFSRQDATRLPTVAELPTFASAEALLRDSQDRLEAAVARFTPEELSAPFTWKNLKLEEKSAPLWVVVRHVVNHGSYHRGQISSMLRRLGGQPLQTDMVLWGIELLAAK
ncbi:MAG: hypothetical protein DIJKHBIC_03169 [Thermoanaerobaculia bacterium]|nr:hypothetical protein [Thermoanaerobaculia bacterium]